MLPSLLGQTLDRYRLDSVPGEGGMGAVFKGFDTILQHEVAVKVMHSQYAQRTDFRERFLNEARTAAHLDHPGIVQVYDFGQARGLLYLVMDFVAGENLRNVLDHLRAIGQWISFGEALRLVRQVSLALDYAHGKGVLHRDIKPDNIILQPEPSAGLPYTPVITDLGLAKLRDEGPKALDGISMGTPPYMSPEQAMSQPTDARSDVYSLGILLFELVTKQLPFPAKTIAEARRYHTQEPPPSPPRSALICRRRWSASSSSAWRKSRKRAIRRRASWRPS